MVSLSGTIVRVNGIRTCRSLFFSTPLSLDLDLRRSPRLLLPLSFDRDLFLSPLLSNPRSGDLDLCRLLSFWFLSSLEDIFSKIIWVCYLCRSSLRILRIISVHSQVNVNLCEMLQVFDGTHLKLYYHADYSTLTHSLTHLDGRQDDKLLPANREKISAAVRSTIETSSHE